MGDRGRSAPEAEVAPALGSSVGDRGRSAPAAEVAPALVAPVAEEEAAVAEDVCP